MCLNMTHRRLHGGLHRIGLRANGIAEMRIYLQLLRTRASQKGNRLFCFKVSRRELGPSRDLRKLRHGMNGARERVTAGTSSLFPLFPLSHCVPSSDLTC